MKPQLVLLVSLVLVSLCRVNGYYCSNKDVSKCPTYTVIKQNGLYETRFYDESNWITTKITRNGGFTGAHNRLKNFATEQKTADPDFPDDTWPVLVSDTLDGQYLSWFVPANVKKPENTDQSGDITFVTRPAGTYYVITFGGIPNPAEGRRERQMLCDALDKEGKHFDHDSFDGAGYESYFSIVHRNEVWIHD